MSWPDDGPGTPERRATHTQMVYQTQRYALTSCAPLDGDTALFCAMNEGGDIPAPPLNLLGS